jgi:hypothetical protein
MSLARRFGTARSLVTRYLEPLAVQRRQYRARLD